MAEIKFISDYGFCPTIINAINNLAKLKKNYKNIYFIDDLIHNRYEMELLKDKFNLIKYGNQKISVDDCVILPLHGFNKDELKNLSKENTIELTCPIIKKREEYLLNVSDDEFKNIILIGKKGHREVESLRSKFPKLIFFDEDDIKGICAIKNRKIKIIFQSTLSILSRDKFINLLKKDNEIEILFDLCPIYFNRLKQIESNLPTVSDKGIVCVFGSSNSSNCKSIINYIKNIRKNVKVLLIESKEEFKKIEKNNRIYITSSTSISKNTIEDAIKN